MARALAAGHVTARKPGASFRAGVFSLLLLAGSGCMRGAVVEARVAAAYDSEATLDTLHDYEVAEHAASARVAELESLLKESGGDERVLVLLARAWYRLSFEFTWDAHERALEAGDAALSGYHLERARGGLERAAHFADLALETGAAGYARAAAQPEALAEFTRGHFAADDAEALLWAGASRVLHAEASSPGPEPDAERRAGVTLLERAVALDAAAGARAHLVLATAALRAAQPDTAAARRELDLARRAAPGRLFVDVIGARYLGCLEHDAAAFDAALGRVLEAGDTAPDLRLENVAAKRRARRYLVSAALRRECFGTTPPSPPGG